jgi:S1-C subfamily serine protease
MNKYLAVCVSLVALGTLALADRLPITASTLPDQIQTQGAPLKSALKPLGPLMHPGFDNDIPFAQLLQIAQQPVRDVATTTRSAKDVEIYRTLSPSVVLVATKDGMGSGSLVSSSGEIITNWHVVRGYSVVGIVFKPAIEGTKPRSDDVKIGRVLKYDQVPDLALIKTEEIPSGRIPIRLGNASEISVGADVSAIGHPTGNDWSYTKGIISQYRPGFLWTAGEETIKHKADAIQTQTPINPGNSGGPLISESGNLIGVNTMKAEGEGLNFAVSVDEVRKFLAKTSKEGPGAASSSFLKRPPDRGLPSGLSQADCQPREISRFRSKANDAAVISYDLDCGGKANANYIVPDRKSDAITLAWDRNADGRPDVVFFDFKRRGKWDLSLWATNFDGQWNFVGYHDDGSLQPTRFETYAEFQRRSTAQR